jgi:hypothetical protein
MADTAGEIWDGPFAPDIHGWLTKAEREAFVGEFGPLVAATRHATTGQVLAWVGRFVRFGLGELAPLALDANGFSGLGKILREDPTPQRAYQIYHENPWLSFSPGMVLRCTANAATTHSAHQVVLAAEVLYAYLARRGQEPDANMQVRDRCIAVLRECLGGKEGAP